VDKQDLIPLEAALAAWADDDRRRQVAETVVSLAEGCVEIAELVARGAIAGRLGALRRASSTGDDQKELDVRANDILIAAARRAPVGVFGSEEMDTSLVLDASKPLAVAVDPLDGSSNIETNVSIGTIFSILPNTATGEPLLQTGAAQLAAGYVIYGPQTALVLTLGSGTDIFTLDPGTGAFLRTAAGVRIPATTSEFAINASNWRFWDAPVRQYVVDCLAGADGPRGRDFNMRWIASMVAECHRVLSRGGVYLYPGDSRRGYGSGRLRLVYEGNPIGFLVEQAGGGCIDGQRRILDLVPESLHQRVPLIFGSANEVEHVERMMKSPVGDGAGSPLFARRGLLRA